MYSFESLSHCVNESSLDPIFLTLKQGCFRVNKDHTVDIFNTHHNPFFLEAWLEEVIEKGRILSEVELVNLFEKYDSFMKKKVLYYWRS